MQLGSPGFPVYGDDVRLFREDGTGVRPQRKGIVGVVPPLPPGCLSTVWGDDKRFVSTLLHAVPGAAGVFPRRLGHQGRRRLLQDPRPHRRRDQRRRPPPRHPRDREAVQSHPAIAEVAVVGVADQLKGQMPMAFAVVKDPATVDTPRRSPSSRRPS